MSAGAPSKLCLGGKWTTAPVRTLGRIPARSRRLAQVQDFFHYPGIEAAPGPRFWDLGRDCDKLVGNAPRTRSIPANRRVSLSHLQLLPPLPLSGDGGSARPVRMRARVHPPPLRLSRGRLRRHARARASAGQRTVQAPSLPRRAGAQALRLDTPEGAAILASAVLRFQCAYARQACGKASLHAS